MCPRAHWGEDVAVISCFLIGSDTLLQECGEVLRARKHGRLLAAPAPGERALCAALLGYCSFFNVDGVIQTSVAHFCLFALMANYQISKRAKT
jgi:hypothetical protein